MSSIKLPLREQVQPLSYKLALTEWVQPDTFKLSIHEHVYLVDPTFKLPLHEHTYINTPSIKLPISEMVRAVGAKMPIHETAWVLEGFVMAENIVSWKSNEIILLENIRSFITVLFELVDKNHVKIKWFGQPVPKVQIFRRRIDEDFGTTPFIELPWNPSEYVMQLDTNGYVIKIVGSQNTGESQQFQVGEDEDYDIAMNVSLPVNQKNYYYDLNLTSEYRFEVNL
jgi:hypothetical protein